MDEKGDVFQNISNAKIINRSNITNAFNRVKVEHGEETGKALADIAEFIEKSGDASAGELFNSFTRELDKPAPEKSRLKSLWVGIEKMLPTLNSIAGTVAKILPLFT